MFWKLQRITKFIWGQFGINIKTVRAIASNSFWIPANILACQTNTVMSALTDTIAVHFATLYHHRHAFASEGWITYVALALKCSNICNANICASLKILDSNEMK
jgi:hypothetical protein